MKGWGTKLSDTEVTRSTPPYADGVLIYSWPSSMVMRLFYSNSRGLRERIESRGRSREDGVDPGWREKMKINCKDDEEGSAQKTEWRTWGRFHWRIPHMRMWFFHSNERDSLSKNRCRAQRNSGDNGDDGDDWRNDDTVDSERREEAVNWRRN